MKSFMEFFEWVITMLILVFLTISGRASWMG